MWLQFPVWEIFRFRDGQVLAGLISCLEQQVWCSLSMDVEAICAGWLIKSPSSKYVTLFSKGKLSIRVPLKSVSETHHIKYIIIMNYSLYYYLLSHKWIVVLSIKFSLNAHFILISLFLYCVKQISCSILFVCLIKEYSLPLVQSLIPILHATATITYY